MTGLILEGGTFRAIFSAGVLDAFIEEEIEFPYVSGVSAGASYVASYLSKQPRRNLVILEEYRNDKRYLSPENMLIEGSLFGMDFVFDEIPNSLVPFDYETFFSYKGKFVVGVTDGETGKPMYLDGMKDNDRWEFLRASCALPGAIKEQYVGGRPCFDGGLSAPVLLRKAVADGCDKMVFILTQPKGFVKKLNPSNVAAAMYCSKKYPKIENELMLRHKLYNDRIKECEKLEREGKAIIIRPAYKLGSFESDISKIRMNYSHGYTLGKKYAEKIKEFMK